MIKIMDLNNIFNLFEKNELNPQSEENKRLVDHFKDHPIVKIGHFKKLILNYNFYGKKLVNSFLNSNNDLDLEDMKKAGDFLLFNKAWENISVIKVEDTFHVECLNKLNNGNELKRCLNKTRKYFEKSEEYEKCGFLKELLSKLGKPEK